MRSKRFSERLAALAEDGRWGGTGVAPSPSPGRREKSRGLSFGPSPPTDPESASDPNLPEPQELHEDSYSCQFPEEEDGYKTAEEKTSLKVSGH